MAITFVAAGTAAEAASGNIASLDYPDGMVTGDVMVAYFVARDNVVISLPAPWTVKATLNRGLSLRITVAWARYSGSGTDVAVTHNLGDVIRGRIFAYRGVTATGDPFEVTNTRANLAAAGLGSWGNLDATTLTAGARWIHCIGVGDDYTTGFTWGTSTGAPAHSATFPADFTDINERDDAETTAGLDISAAYGDAIDGTPGSTGTAWVWEPTASASSVEFVGALTPEPESSPNLTRGDANAQGLASVASVPATRADATGNGRDILADINPRLPRGDATADGRDLMALLPAIEQPLTRGGAVCPVRLQDVKILTSTSWSKTLEGWAYSPDFYFTSGATDEYALGSSAVAAGWRVRSMRAAWGMGNTGATCRLRLLNNGTQIGSDVVVPVNAGYNGSFNEINYLADSGMVSVGTPVPSESISNLRIQLIGDGGNFSYHQVDPVSIQVEISPPAMQSIPRGDAGSGGNAPGASAPVSIGGAVSGMQPGSIALEGDYDVLPRGGAIGGFHLPFDNIFDAPTIRLPAFLELDEAGELLDLDEAVVGLDIHDSQDSLQLTDDTYNVILD